MRTCPITTPDQLHEIMLMVKWDKDRTKAMEYADEWYRSKEQRSVTLEVGKKNAQIVVTEDGKRSTLANLYMAAAKDYIAEHT